MPPYVIKDIVKKGKSKSVIVPNGGAIISGQTNATNPTTLRELQDNFHDYQRSVGVSQELKPSRPAKVMPVIGQQFKRMGELLGICPYELETIMKAEFTEDQELAVSLLKKFVSAVKLSAAVDMTKTHKTLKDARDSHAKMEDNWKKKCDAIDVKNQKVLNDQQTSRGNLYKAWGNILIDLSQKVMRNADIKTLGEWDQLMLKALERTDKNLCQINKDTVSLDFAACKVMKPEAIGKLPTIARQIQNEIEEARWYEWLNKATVEELMDRLWNASDDSERAELELAITAKKGRIPIRDRWGNLNWHATFSQDNDLDLYEAFYDEDLSEEEEYEIKRMQDLLEARVSLGISPRGYSKVKSGSGKPKK